MKEIKLAVVEAQFADIIWKNAPMTTRNLVSICATEMNWKRTTTYTVLKKLCDRGIFATKDRIITVLLSKDEFHAIQSEYFVEHTFNGSLPAFLAAFGSRKKLSAQEIQELQAIIDAMREE